MNYLINENYLFFFLQLHRHSEHNNNRADRWRICLLWVLVICERGFFLDNIQRHRELWHLIGRFLIELNWITCVVHHLGAKARILFLIQSSIPYRWISINTSTNMLTVFDNNVLLLMKTKKNKLTAQKTKLFTKRSTHRDITTLLLCPRWTVAVATTVAAKIQLDFWRLKLNTVCFVRCPK